MDQHKLRSLVFEKTGVRVDVDDPIFALVALNEAVLAEAVERHVALIDAASLELAQQARQMAGLGRVEHGAHAHAPALNGAASTPSDYLDATNEAPLAADGAVAGTTPHAPSDHAPAPATPRKPSAAQSPLVTPREARLLGAAAGVSLLCALLVLGGQALFFTPKPVPAPVLRIQARALTPEQTLALQNGEKLARAVQKLDPKTRAQIQAELQKP